MGLDQTDPSTSLSQTALMERYLHARSNAGHFSAQTGAGPFLESIPPDFPHRVAGTNSIWSWIGLAELGSWWTWAGILAFVASFGGWLYALRFLPLGLAFALTNGVHIFVPIGSWYFLGDHIGWLRASGIIIIISGILLLAQSVAEAEEKV
jgi:drug/metabolite transporter (DMT)-like permease